VLLGADSDAREDAPERYRGSPGANRVGNTADQADRPLRFVIRAGADSDGRVRSLATRPLGLAQTHSRASAILVDELDAGRLQGASNYFKGRAARLAQPGFQLMHRHDPNGGMVGKILLTPVKEGTCGSTLCWLHHRRKIAQLSNFCNSIRNLLTHDCVYYIWLHIFFM
jgi:hypothetical protein